VPLIYIKLVLSDRYTVKNIGYFVAGENIQWYFLKMKALILLLLLNISFAKEPRVSLNEAQKAGFSPVTYSKSPLKSAQRLQHAELEWPFERPYSEGLIGNNFAQFQPYTIPGYHGGLDMILEKHSWVTAPISGRLEAGHYTYTEHEDGTSTKHWKAWPSSGPSAYFEVAVIDENNLRYELHHIDKGSLTDEVISQLKSNSATIKKGQRVGRVYKWGTFFHYHHVHLNVVTETGEHLNPESFFRQIKDNKAPVVKILAKYEDKSVWFNEGDKLNKRPKSFIIIGHDKKNNNKFNQVPTYFRLSINGEDISIYDFRMSHKNQDNKFADIRDVYPQRVTLPNGDVLKHNTGYYPNGVNFMVELLVPKDAGPGQVELTISDNAQNDTIIKGNI